MREVSFEEYLRLLEDNKRNPYLTSQCRQEQRAFSYIEDNKIKEEDDEIELTNKKLIPFKLKRYKEQIKMCSFSY